MTKLLLAILLVISTVAVVAHGVLVYQLSSVESVIAEEESSGEKPFIKEGKDLGKDKIAFSFDSYKYALVKTMSKSALEKTFSCSKGFYDKPYNPPEAI